MPTFAESVAAGGRQVGRPRDDDSIELAPYDAAWPSRFEEIRDRLAAALGPTAVRIDHVGSTAVPGLTAKPVIDVQVSVPDVENEAAYKDAIEGLGFELRWIGRGHRYFRPPQELPRRTQVHVCQIGSEWAHVHLLFRDYLRTHPGAANDYAELKQRLAKQFPNDRIAYTDAKGPFVEAILVAAEEWANSEGWQA